MIWLRLVSALVPLVYPQSSVLPATEIDLSAGDLFTLLISHSKFLTLMITTDPEEYSYTADPGNHPAKGECVQRVCHGILGGEMGSECCMLQSVPRIIIREFTGLLSL